LSARATNEGAARAKRLHEAFAAETVQKPANSAPRQKANSTSVRAESSQLALLPIIAGALWLANDQFSEK
jgi:hypothetical protein